MPAARLFACLVAVSFAAAIAAGCGGEIPDDSICVVGETEVTNDRFDQALRAARAQAKARTGAAPKGDDLDELRRQVAAQLVNAAAWRDLATGHEVTISDKDVSRAERKLVTTGFGGDRKRYEAQLEVEGRTAAQARADLRDQLYVEAVQQAVSKDVTVSDKEARAWLAAHPGDFGGTPRRREVQHVLIRDGGKAEAADDAAAKAFAERTRRELEGASEREFAEIARRFSDDPSFGPSGGGFTYESGTIDPAFERAVFELDTNELSQPVRTRLGWHVIVPRGEVVKERLPDFDEVADEVRDAARAAEREEALAALQRDVEDVVKDASCRKEYRPERTPSATTKTDDRSAAAERPKTTRAPDTETASP